MSRMWYLSRNGQVYGPLNDPQLAQWVADGHVFPTDQLNVVGQPYWVLASAVPGLLPAPEPLSLDDDPEPPVVMKSLKVTCFACFSEVMLEFAAGTQTAPCPECRAALETGEPASTAPAGAAAFAALESPAAFAERMQQKVAALNAPDGPHGKIGRHIAAGRIGPTATHCDE